MPRPVTPPPLVTPTSAGPLLEWVVRWTDGSQHRRLVTHAPDIEVAAWSASRSLGIGTLDQVTPARILSITLAEGGQS